MTKYLQLIKLRWTTLATFALCMLLPGCPLTDNYFTERSWGGSGGTAALASAGAASESSMAGTRPTAGGAESGGDAPVSGGASTDAGAANTDAGSSDDAGANNTAGNSNAGTSGVGGMGGTGGAPIAGGPPIGGSSGGGTVDTGGAASNIPQPACKDGVIKGSACTAASAQFCYKGCGPDNSGYKSETCQAGAYVEQSGCTFPSGEDYACYKLPQSLPAECPSTVPRGGSACQIPACLVCYGGTTANPLYQDSTGTPKAGYCVCADSGVWTCGSIGAWPCPGGNGCD